MPMKELRSFKDAIENSFYPQIESALSAYITDNADRLDVRSNSVEDVDEAELCDLMIKRVDVHDAAGDGIQFDIVCEAEITVSSRYHSDVEMQTKYHTKYHALQAKTSKSKPISV
jgi:hypothetical protein